VEIRKLTSDEFYPLFRQHRPEMFADTLWFSSREVRTEHEQSQITNLLKGLEDVWSLHLGLYENNELIGWCSSFAMKANELYMMNSAVFPDHRRKGYYTVMVKEVLKEAKLAGFQTVTSQHVCTNNDVIIPKLKLDFKITGMQVMDEFGVTVSLTYFLNETRAKAMEFRSGSSKPDLELKKLFKL
jgi:GNAT superfamily N-acetyltransferase